jgi:hypothetical protein
MREIFHDHFTYDAETGQLHWRKHRRRARIGDVAGTLTREGYICIKLYSVQHKAHRIIWCMHYGDPVPYVISHIDGDNANNRLANLRDDEAVTASESAQLKQKLLELGVMR